MEQFDITVTISARVTQKDIDDIMCSALEGGINYWCNEAEVVGDYLGEFASDQISRGGTLILYDAESDDKWELTREKFLDGVSLWIKHGNSNAVSGETGELDTYITDAEDADEIVQYALFGEIVFG